MKLEVAHVACACALSPNQKVEKTIVSSSPGTYILLIFEIWYLRNTRMSVLTAAEKFYCV